MIRVLFGLRLVLRGVRVRLVFLVGTSRKEKEPS